MQLGLRAPQLLHHNGCNLHPQAQPTPVLATRRAVQLRHPSRTCTYAQPAVATQKQAPAAPAGPSKDPWKRVVEAEEKGETVEVVVKSFNKGGLIVSLGELKGFLPYNQLASNSLKKGHMGDMSFLVGQKLRARIITVDLQGPKRDIVLSERKAVLSEQLRRLKVGDTMRGVITHVEEYGAFVDLVDIPGVSGLVHKSEISWAKLLSVEAAVQKDQRVNVKVIDVDPNKCRLNLSIKQLQPDPLKTTLDTLEWGPTRQIPAEIQRLADKLGSYPQVDNIMILRQAQDATHISQELQVFMTREDSPDGCIIVARLGSVLQEMQVTTQLPRDSVKELLQQAVKAV